MRMGVYRIRERGTDNTVADVKLVDEDGGLYVYVRWGGVGDWEEDTEAYGLLLGDLGAVEFVGAEG